MVAKYTQGNGIDEPLSMWRGGTTACYSTDGLGLVSHASLAHPVLQRRYKIGKAEPRFQ